MKVARKKSRYRWLRQDFLIKQLGQKLSILIEAKKSQPGFMRRFLAQSAGSPPVVFEVVKP